MGKKGFCLSPSFRVLLSTVIAGESGLVYHGYINSAELVAVKTGKGNTLQ